MKLRKIKLHQVSRKTIKRKEAMTVLAVMIIKLLRGRRTKIVIILRKLHQGLSPLKEVKLLLKQGQQSWFLLKVGKSKRNNNHHLNSLRQLWLLNRQQKSNNNNWNNSLLVPPARSRKLSQQILQKPMQIKQMQQLQLNRQNRRQIMERKLQQLHHLLMEPMLPQQHLLKSKSRS